jgi:hypothetical protein
LLDNESTMNLFCNKKFVTDITKSNDSVKVTSNGGTLLVHHKANLPGYHKPVWYNKNAITNILALHNVKRQYRVTYDSQLKTGNFIVHMSDQGPPNLKFKMHPSGLHVYDPADNELVMVNTVKGNMEGYTKKQLEGAKLAKELYAKLAYPSPKDFK